LGRIRKRHLSRASGRLENALEVLGLALIFESAIHMIIFASTQQLEMVVIGAATAFFGLLSFSLVAIRRFLYGLSAGIAIGVRDMVNESRGTEPDKVEEPAKPKGWNFVGKVFLKDAEPAISPETPVEPDRPLSNKADLAKYAGEIKISQPSVLDCADPVFQRVDCGVGFVMFGRDTAAKIARMINLRVEVIRSVVAELCTKSAFDSHTDHIFDLQRKLADHQKSEFEKEKIESNTEALIEQCRFVIGYLVETRNQIAYDGRVSNERSRAFSWMISNNNTNGHYYPRLWDMIVIEHGRRGEWPMA
jgi:hypothetical protein